jgi:GNAT superfamily N-acetyltransferase
MALGFVRPARPADAAEIARIQLATWRTAYRRLLPTTVVNDIDEEWMVARWRDAIIAPPTPEHHVLVAVDTAVGDVAVGSDDGEPLTAGAASAYPVGFAAIGPADDAALAPDETLTDLGTAVGAVTELLVEPRWGRRGHGSRLLSACVDLWRSDRRSVAVSWAFADDHVTRRFLETAGWAADGGRRALDLDDLLVPQIRLHTSILHDDFQPHVTSA